jgi:nucleoside-diphosphate-sugar epimerase
VETINRKILVTGSVGFIMSAFVLRLLALGHTVIGIDNHINFSAWYRNELKLI